MCERALSKKGFCFCLTTQCLPPFPHHSGPSAPGDNKTQHGGIMIKISLDSIKRMESNYPGITEQIWRFEHAELPPCPDCGSGDTASVQYRIIGRTISLAVTTTKIHLRLNNDGKGIYYCNTCKARFGPVTGSVRKMKTMDGVFPDHFSSYLWLKYHGENKDYRQVQ